jgi:hypothetical protein
MSIHNKMQTQEEGEKASTMYSEAEFFCTANSQQSKPVVRSTKHTRRHTATTNVTFPIFSPQCESKKLSLRKIREQESRSDTHKQVLL